MSEHAAAAPVAPLAAPPRIKRVTGALDLGLEIVTVSLLVATVVIALIQVFWRYVLDNSLSWPEELARWAFVWLVFLGSAMLTHRQGHIVIDLLPRSLGPRGRTIHAVAVRIVLAAAAALLVVYGLDLVQRATYKSPALQWPTAYLALAIPVGATLTLVFLAANPIGGIHSRFAGLIAAIAGILLFAALSALSDFPFASRTDVTWTLLVLAIGLMLAGVPIADSLIFGAFVAFLPQGELFLLTVPQNMTASLDSFLLLAIPFFILAAALMNATSITETLIALATTLVGHFRGGLGHVNVLTNVLMGGHSGSSAADAAAIAKMMVEPMARRGYPKPFGCALTASGSILANMLPPGLGLIIYAALASVSVGALFVASVVPGLLMALTLSIVVHIETIRHGYGDKILRAPWKERWSAAKVALPALILPLVIVGGIRYGLFTATEAGAVAVLYSLLCGVLYYRNTGLATIVATLRESLSETVALMIIIAASAPFAWILVIEQVPQKLAQSMSVLTSHWVLLLLVLNAFLIFVGLAMEMIASMVILVPILVPLLKAGHVDLVHFGVIIVANLCIGALTPPLALLIFATARVTHTPTHEVYRACRPFLAGLLIWLVLITMVPALSLYPVRLFGP